MGRKRESIYNLISNNYSLSEDIIDAIIEELTEDEKNILHLIYGSDLKNVDSNINIDENTKKTFYNRLLPKIKKKAASYQNNLTNNEENINDNIDFGKLNHEDDSNIEVFDANKDYNKISTQAKGIILPDSKICSNLTFEIMNCLRQDESKKVLSSKEICQKFNITRDQLFDELNKIKNLRGDMTKKTINLDGSFDVRINDPRLRVNENKQYIKINTASDYTINFIALSDIHYGNTLSGEYYVNYAYEYALQKGINIILCSGDIIDGKFTKGTQTLSNPFDQVDRFIQKYPKDDSIVTLAVGGDHDMSVKIDYCDLINVCDSYRPDIIIGGYNNTMITLNGTQILLYHQIEGGIKFNTSEPAITLNGHTHDYSLTKKWNGSIDINVPTISNIINTPHFIDCSLEFKDSKPYRYIIKLISINKELNNTYCKVIYQEDTIFDNDYLIENSKKNRVVNAFNNTHGDNINLDNQQTLSMIDKFYERKKKTEQIKKNRGCK